MANEKRLIDLDKLIDSLKGTQVDKYYPEWNDMTPLAKAVVVRTIRAYREVVLNQPTVNAIEIVRCKNCYWAALNTICAPPRYCCTNPKGLCRTVKDDDFCSYGERKEG